MKKLFISFLVILFGVSVTGQPLTREDYLRKSKNQKTWAWLLTGGGVASVVGGVAITGSTDSYFPSETVGPIMIAGGGAAIAGGIVLFSASKRNKSKASEVSAALNLKMEETKIYLFSRVMSYHFPALSVSILIK